MWLRHQKIVAGRTGEIFEAVPGVLIVTQLHFSLPNFMYALSTPPKFRPSLAQTPLTTVTS